MATPRCIAPAKALFGDTPLLPAAGPARWTPAASLPGPVSIVVSSTDQCVAVLCNGVVIGEAPVEVAVEHGGFHPAL